MCTYKNPKKKSKSVLTDDVGHFTLVVFRFKKAVL